MAKPAPRLPYGDMSLLQSVTDNFAFHASPELFIADRVSALVRDRPDVYRNHEPLRIKILNRNVAVISGYTQTTSMLEDGQTQHESTSKPCMTARDAYEDLMGPFFPSPNLLLADGDAHACMRDPWERSMGPVVEHAKDTARKFALRHFRRIESGTTIDLYDSMKELSWKILLGSFLQLEYGQRDYDNIMHLQEELLRGQFSLFPVSINAGFWRSPRSKGIAARKKLQQDILKRLVDCPEASPFNQNAQVPQQQVVDHTLLFTSSLAAKALASLLTATLMNLFLLGEAGSASSLAVQIKEERYQERSRERLESIVLETERLSPPIVGIMRRVGDDWTLKNPKSDEADVLIPKGWDAWFYFVGAGRDASIFGSDSELFDADRYAKGRDLPKPLAFGCGPKTCLGRSFSHEVVLSVAKTCIDMGMTLSGHVERPGVRAWLGWKVDEGTSPSDWARDMKQLPTQRPVGPVLVNLTCRHQTLERE